MLLCTISATHTPYRAYVVLHLRRSTYVVPTQAGTHTYPWNRYPLGIRAVSGIPNSVALHGSPPARGRRQCQLVSATDPPSAGLPAPSDTAGCGAGVFEAVTAAFSARSGFQTTCSSTE